MSPSQKSPKHRLRCHKPRAITHDHQTLDIRPLKKLVRCLDSCLLVTFWSLGRTIQTVRHASDRRSTARFGVPVWRATFAYFLGEEGEGTIHELSLRGCRMCLESPPTTYSPLLLQLQILTPDSTDPLFIQEALVKWKQGLTLGLSFVRIDPVNEQSLYRVIKRLSGIG